MEKGEKRAKNLRVSKVNGNTRKEEGGSSSCKIRAISSRKINVGSPSTFPTLLKEVKGGGERKVFAAFPSYFTPSCARVRLEFHFFFLSPPRDKNKPFFCQYYPSIIVTRITF